MNTHINTLSGYASAEVIADALKYPPSAPRVLPLLKRRLMTLDVSIQQITDIIRLDPGISARVLQAANSVMFSRGERCHSVELAVNRVGFDNIYEMVANAVAEQVLVRPLAAYALDADEFWRRSVTCGLAAEFIAEQCGLDRNVAYTLGLFNGVGMVAIDQWMQLHEPNTGFFSRGFPRDFSDGEKVLVGCTNAEVGAAVLRGWEFPPEMVEPIRWQYKPLEVLAFRELNCVLHAAKWLSARVCASPEEKVSKIDLQVLKPIKLSETMLLRQVDILSNRMESVQRSLEIDFDGEAA